MLSKSTDARSEFQRWMSNATTASINMVYKYETNRPDLTLTTDTSTTGWRQSMKENRLEGLEVLKNNVPAIV